MWQCDYRYTSTIIIINYGIIVYLCTYILDDGHSLHSSVVFSVMLISTVSPCAVASNAERPTMLQSMSI